jgi:hypothetical protein
MSRGLATASRSRYPQLRSLDFAVITMLGSAASPTVGGTREFQENYFLDQAPRRF